MKIQMSINTHTHVYIYVVKYITKSFNSISSRWNSHPFSFHGPSHRPRLIGMKSWSPCYKWAGSQLPCRQTQWNRRGHWIGLLFRSSGGISPFPGNTLWDIHMHIYMYIYIYVYIYTCIYMYIYIYTRHPSSSDRVPIVFCHIWGYLTRLFRLRASVGVSTRLGDLTRPGANYVAYLHVTYSVRKEKRQIELQNRCQIECQRGCQDIRHGEDHTNFTVRSRLTCCANTSPKLARTPEPSY